MSLPGLELAEASTEAQYAPPPPTQVNLRAGSEWRFEIAFGATVRVKLLTGTAELFGTELAPLQTYTFSGTKAAIYTWHGCMLEVAAGETVNLSNGFAPGGSTAAGGSGQTQGYGAGGCQSEYVAEETPMIEYSNVHFGLETLRQEAQNEGGKDGPRVLILGPENAGKTTLTKILTGYATKMDRQPIVVNLDPTEGMLSVPGTLTATAFRSMLDVEEGWGSSPMSGPSPTPVKLPLVYFYPMKSPFEADGNVFKPIVSRLALSVTARMAEDDDAREAGIIVDTDGSLGQGSPKSLELINHIVTEFSISTILVIGSERLYSTMVKNYDQKPTTSASATHSDERITVLKLSKSGGCVDRDESFMKAVNESQIRSYFFGTAATSAATSTSIGGVIGSISGAGGSNSNKITLSPHTQQLDFGSLALYNYTITSSLAEDDEDEYDPSNFGTGTESFSSLSNPPQETRSMYDPSSSNTEIPLKKFTQPPTLALANSLIAITHVPPNAPLSDIRDSSIMGFVYVADVDAEKKKLRVLAPVGGRMPARALVWGKNWPGEVVGLVG
ncbi:mRNA cleavage factor complex II protein Clp1, putative [Talaromyces stipitatus ATCC 10500]|uniref:Polynucleotide 5'-hydroxyl-kinase GRC3 n=1 Tax=Talaromyces stipitatus (strain ATCC 10500 / CBS 375.48 / QM 6759 / NRRL 1006) TaxID=441959 RepID=B8LTF3_TALSN|nr:mRNA cleavage factor complex II protein Clp1, putative [Talaromyces stipitatus ATCC 10500]EED23031.1 mRNA cleavage factor complex II protein Clp1, putative [Talaromyces stipitatus ATCC 10500]